MAVLGPSAGELIYPYDFYSRRSRELRGGADEMAARYSKHTQILVFLGFLACLAMYQSLIAKRLPVWTVGGLVPVAAWVVQKAPPVPSPTGRTLEPDRLLPERNRATRTEVG